ncbi:hypothetical protein BH11MYX4_BH11MYX4_06270 [soil metagenome]
MKVVCVSLALVAALCVHCGGETPPVQDPSAVPAASTGDVDAAAPIPAPDPSKK